MSFERGDITVNDSGRDLVICDGGDCITLTIDEARWMQAVALPAALAEAGKLIEIGASDDGDPERLPGQASIDEVLAD